jgi:hypothetical protein
MAASSLHQFCEWLSSTRISNTIQDVSWIIPAVQTVHIACIAVLIGSVVMLDLRMFGIAGRGDSVAVTAKRLLPWIWWPLPVFLTTGLILIVAEPSRELENTTFYNKMILLVGAIIVTGVLQATLQRNPAFWEGSRVRSSAAKGLAFVSLALFVGIVFAGRLIAYTDHP